MGGASGPLALLTPAADPSVDQAGIAGESGLGADAEAVGDTGAEALDQDVGVFGEREGLLDALGALEVEGDGTTAAGERVLRRARAVGAGGRAGRPVDPYDIGAEPGQDGADERGGRRAREFQYTHSGQRSGHGQLP